MAVFDDGKRIDGCDRTRCSDCSTRSSAVAPVVSPSCRTASQAGFVPDENTQRSENSITLDRRGQEPTRTRDVKVRGKDHKRRQQGIWPVTYKWMAMGTLVAYTALGGQKIDVALAQGTQGPAMQGQPKGQAAVPTKRFDIPAQTLGDALDAFHAATEVEVTVANEGICNVQSPGVTGVYTNEQALERLLSGTGISYRFTTPKLVRLDVQPDSGSAELARSSGV